jgi:hypothetical protein
MRSVRAAMIAVLFLLTAGTVMADSVQGTDPGIGVKGGHHTSISTISADGLNFQFTIDGQGGGIFDLVNNSGVNWTSVTLFASAPIGSLFTCDPKNFGHLFLNCTVTQQPGQEAVTVFFSGVNANCGTDNCFPGIPAGFQFFFNLNNDFNCTENCPGGWTANFVVHGGGNQPPGVPEPASVFLVLTGLGGIAARRRHSAYLARRS